jgi:LmbE family N-acetylglucosaminyl deacetylase
MLSLPPADLDDITGPGTVLILAPHPDDESLGCGGLIAEACARGRPPVLAILTDGAMSHPASASHPAPVLRARREQETLEAAAQLGLPASRVHFLAFPDSRAPLDGPELAEAAARVAALAGQHGAGCILSTWEHDPHGDHLSAHRVAAEAARLAGTRLVSYPVWGWMLPGGQHMPSAEIAGARLDIARHLPAKRRAIMAHASQHGGIPDDPEGFRLPVEFLAVHDRGFEVFLFPSAAGLAR